MLNISEELKTIYRNDRVPMVSKLAYKEIKLYFPELDLTINTDRIVDDSFSLQESLCSSDDITLGACEGAILKITVANLIQDLSGQEFIITQIVNGAYEMPLGTYRIASCKKQNDLWFREIVAYDSMIKTNVDVSDWYNNLTWPQTVKSMRESLLTHLGIEFEEQTLTNDNATLENTLTPSGLVARDILSRLCEINAGFGHITRYNKFKVIQLSGLGLYPSETLYPSEDLFPSESGEYITAGYENTEYEEYIVESITSVTIREDDSDYGTTAGIEGNPYIIEGNYLLFGKSSVQMQGIVDNILLQVKNKFYRPHKTLMIGLPYMEVGDSVNIMTDADAVESFIFRRTLKGIQSLQDDISASGNKKRSQQIGLNTQIKQLKGKTLRLVKTVDELSSTMTDMEEGLESKITQTAGQLQTQITDNKNDLQSQITQSTGQILQTVTDTKNDLQGQINVQAGIIDLKVSNNGIIAAINLSSEGIKIDASKLTITGFVTFNDLSSSGSTIINGDNIRTGKIEGVTFKSVGSRGTIIMQDGYIRSEYNNLSTWIEFGLISVGNGTASSQITATYIDTNEVRANKASIPTITDVSDLTVTRINGYTPVTYGNTANLIVGYAEMAFNAGTANNANNASNAYNLTNGSSTVYISVNSNVIPVGSSVGMGSSANRYTNVYGNNVYNSNGLITTSDIRKKQDITEIDERFLKFARLIKPYCYKMIAGTSGRQHLGFIAQYIEDAMIECGISDIEFGGLVKDPVYAIQFEDGEYDNNSEIVDYEYSLRYEEFIPLLFLLINSTMETIS